jgi:hypothetical protein
LAATASGWSGCFLVELLAAAAGVVDRDGSCCIWSVRGMLKSDADWQSDRQDSSSNATANRRFTGSSTASS